MASGYLLLNRKFSWKEHYEKLIKIIVMYIVASMLCLFYKYSQGNSLLVLIRGIFTFETAGYSWYIKYYIVLYLFIPFINKLFRRIDGKQQIALIGCFVVIASLGAYGRYTNTVENSILLRYIFKVLKNMFPAMYYCMGIWIRENNVLFHLNKKYCFGAAGILIIFVMCNSIYMHLKNYGEIVHTIPNGYGTWNLVGISFLLFILLFYIGEKRRMTKMECKYLVILSNSTLVAYLVSEISDSIWRNAVGKMQLPLPWYMIVPCVIVTAVFSLVFGVWGTKLSDRIVSMLFKRETT